MDDKGDIPDRSAVEPPSDATVGPTGLAKVAMIDTVLNSGGTIHAYLPSVAVPQDGAEDFHLHDFNTHRYTETGWIYVHGDDRDKWIPGDDIGMLERHYE